MFFVVIVIVLAVCAFVCQASTKYAREAVRNIPGPYCIPLLGCLHVAIGITPKNFHKKAMELQSQYGSVFRSWVFNRLFISSSDAELNEQLLTSTSLIKKMPMYGILQQWLGAGLLLSDGKKWHSRRKIITPAFHFNILEQFLEVFDRQSSILISCLAERADGQTAFDIHPYISAATLDVIAETAMGTKVNAQTDKSVLYTAAVKEMTHLMTWRYIRVHLNNEVVFALLHPHKKLRQMKLISIMHDFTKNVIEERRKVLENSLKKNTPTSHGEQDDRDSGVGLRKRMALLDVLLQTSIDDQALSNADILEEVNTFMFAGHDTTASAISFTLHQLARAPRVQNKLLAEICQVCGDNNATPFPLANLKDLKYLDCVIKESLRIYAPVPIIGREITEDFKYKHSRLGEGVIPAGTEFIAVIAQPALEEQHFKNASDFFPERHESGDIKTGFTFIPFSAGPRNCIGQKFALSEMKVMLAQIVREYELLPLGADIEKMLSIVLSSRTGMQLGLRKRTID